MKVLSNYINNDIKTCNNCGLMMVWGLNQLFMIFNDFSNKFKDFINIHEYANKISCISIHGFKEYVKYSIWYQFKVITDT